MPIVRSTSSERRSISALLIDLSWVFSVSEKCSLIRMSGFSRVSGSWKIIAEVAAAHGVLLLAA